MSSSNSFAKTVLVLLLPVILVTSVGAVQQTPDESSGDDAAARSAADDQQREAANANSRNSPYARAGARYANWDEYRQAVSSTYAAEDSTRYAMRAIGMDTWYHWTAGNQFFFRGLTRQTEGNVDFFRVIVQTPRSERFRRIGGINDPSCSPASQPDEFGLTQFDQWKPEEKEAWEKALERTYPDRAEREIVKRLLGEPTGIIGLRKFPNPLFPPGDTEQWRSGVGLARYLEDPAKYEPPYLIGMSCALCHVAFEPTRPPRDPSEPYWENVSALIGNQYLEESAMFTLRIMPDNFVWQIGHAQQAGTSDTSRISNDMFNNPNAINSVYQLAARNKLKVYEEITPQQAAIIREMPEEVSRDLHPTESKLLTMHVLKDGSDSMGVALASLRVYTNIGLFTIDDENLLKLGVAQRTYRDALEDGQYDDAERGRVAQQLRTVRNMFASALARHVPYDIATARSSRPIPPDPQSEAVLSQLPPDLVARYAKNFWMLTEERMPAMEAFLTHHSADVPLLDSPQLRDEPVFSADGSVKTVNDYLARDRSLVPGGMALFAQHCAACHSSRPLEPKDSYTYEDFVNFRAENFLSDDKRYPVTQIQTNSSRSLGTNPRRGQLWEQFSSETYKQLPSAGTLVNLFNPVTLQSNLTFRLPAGGGGYYRTPSLCGLWATAPYFHNNSLGDYPQKDPSVAARIDAFENGMNRLLNPDRRLGIRSMKLTTKASFVPDSEHLSLRHPLRDRSGAPINVPQGTPINFLANVRPDRIMAKMEEVGRPLTPQEILDLNQCPDVVEDRGHYFGAGLEDEDQRALISVLKRL